MANIGLLDGEPTAGLTDGVLIDAGNPIAGPDFFSGADTIGSPQRLAVRVLVGGYQRAGAFTIELVGATADRWSLAPDAGGVPGAWGAWGASLTLPGPVIPVNTIFWARSRALAGDPVGDTLIVFRTPDDVVAGAPVGRSWAIPYNVGAIQQVGRSWVIPYSVLVSVGRSWALPATVLASVGRSWSLPYAIASSTTTVSFNPSSDAPVSGYAEGSTWATVRAQNPGYAAYPTATYIPVFSRGGTATPNIFRGHLHFNTASIPDGATIVAARLKLYGSNDSGQAKANFDSSSAIVLLESLMTAGATATTWDYPTSKFGTTELAARATHSAWTDNAYNVITLNASGLALISKTGTTRLAVREASDFDNSDPGSGTPRGLYFYTVDHATAGKWPVLEVDYV